MHPALRGRPVMVATWVVMAASYEARAYGIHSGMHATDAHRLLSGGGHGASRARRPTPRRVGSCSRSSTHARRSSSATGSRRRSWKVPPTLGERLRARVRRRGRPAGHRRCREHEDRRQDGQPGGEAGRAAGRAATSAAFLHAHRVEQLWGIGARTAAKLHAAAIATVGEAAALSEPELVALLGRGNGRRVHALVNNRDRRPVEPGGPPRSFGSTRSLGTRRRPAGGAGRGRGPCGRAALPRPGRPVARSRCICASSDHTLAARSRTLPVATADANDDRRHRRGLHCWTSPTYG